MQSNTENVDVPNSLCNKMNRMRQYISSPFCNKRSVCRTQEEVTVMNCDPLGLCTNTDSSAKYDKYLIK